MASRPYANSNTTEGSICWLRMWACRGDEWAAGRHAARELQPGLKVLFITGFAESVAVGGEALGPGMQLLTKPFTMEALAGRIRSMLHGD